MSKIRVYRDYSLSESGVERVWAAKCPDHTCEKLGISYMVALYWENIIRSKDYHLAFHRNRERDSKHA